MYVSYGEITGSYDHLHLEISITGVPQSFLPSGLATSVQQLLQGGYLQIILLKSDSLPILPVTPGSTQDTTGYSSKFYMQNATANLTQNAADQTQIDIALVFDVYNNTSVVQSVALSSLAETVTDSSGTSRQGIRINGQFVVKNQPPISLDPNPTIIYQNFNKPNEAPGSFALTPIHKGLSVSWTSGTPVAYTGSDTATRTPSQVMVMLFDTTKFSGSIDGAIVDDTAGQDKTVSCPVDLNSSSCIGSCVGAATTDPVYIKQSQTNTTGLSVSIANNSGSFSLTDLDPNTTYVMVMQYLDGTKQTSCLSGEPELLSSFLELNGDKEATPGDPRCFIVSATYNSPFSKHVDIFRWVRDHLLLTNEIGHAFVDYYYDHAKPVADVIYAYPILQIPMQALLFVPALLFYSIKFFSEGPLGTLPLTLLFMMGFACVALIRKWLKK